MTFVASLLVELGLLPEEFMAVVGAIAACVTIVKCWHLIRAAWGNR